jgi:hypothetical protein
MSFDSVVMWVIAIFGVGVPIWYTIWWTNKHQTGVSDERRHQDIRKRTRR